MADKYQSEKQLPETVMPLSYEVRGCCKIRKIDDRIRRGGYQLPTGGQ